MGELVYNKTILIVGVGTSPGVITSTVEALFNEDIDLVPDDIIVITTVPGKSLIEVDLLTNNSWDLFCENYRSKCISLEDKLRFGSSNSIKILGDNQRDFDDITNLYECDQSAERILEIIRTYTSNPNTRVLISIAGGRKSLSALMFSCMTLLAREQDRIFHVFITEPGNETPTIAEISFVRLRGWVEQNTGSTTPSYIDLVKILQGQAPEAINYHEIKIKLNGMELFIDGVNVKLSEKEFGLLFMYCFLISKKKLNSKSQYDFEQNELKYFSEEAVLNTNQEWLINFDNWLNFQYENANYEKLNQALSKLRKKIEPYVLNSKQVDLLIPKFNRKDNNFYPKAKIVIKQQKQRKTNG